MIVYVYTFPNRKKYVGQTVLQLSDRTGANGIKYADQLVGKAIEKYGWDSIEKEIFECKSQEEMDALEIELIAKYRTTEREFGYNVEEGGKHPHHLSEETKQKMREAKLGKHHSEETKQKIREAALGKHRSEETKQKIREAKLGEKNIRSKPVRCVETGEVFASAGEAARAKGLCNGSGVGRAANGYSKTAAGYHWEWV